MLTKYVPKRMAFVWVIYSLTTRFDLANGRGLNNYYSYCNPIWADEMQMQYPYNTYNLQLTPLSELFFKTLFKIALLVLDTPTSSWEWCWLLLTTTCICPEEQRWQKMEKSVASSWKFSKRTQRYHAESVKGKKLQLFPFHGCKGVEGGRSLSEKWQCV